VSVIWCLGIKIATSFLETANVIKNKRVRKRLQVVTMFKSAEQMPPAKKFVKQDKFVIAAADKIVHLMKFALVAAHHKNAVTQVLLKSAV
jgi:hypothetical protein